MRILILALLFTSILCIKHKLRSSNEPRPFESFTMEEECKIQRCIMTDMANSWPTLYGKEEGRRRQVECFKNCHMVTCEKKKGKGNYACKLNESGKPYPDDYEYEPLTESFEDYKDNKRAQDYVTKRNA